MKGGSDLVKTPKIEGKLDLAEVKRRGEARYDELRLRVESERVDDYIAIDVESGDFEIAERRAAAWKAIHTRYPDSQAYIRRIGEEPEPLLAARAFGGGSRSLAWVPDPKK